MSIWLMINVRSLGNLSTSCGMVDTNSLRSKYMFCSPRGNWPKFGSVPLSLFSGTDNCVKLANQW